MWYEFYCARCTNLHAKLVLQHGKVLIFLRLDHLTRFGHLILIVRARGSFEGRSSGWTVIAEELKWAARPMLAWPEIGQRVVSMPLIDQTGHIPAEIMLMQGRVIHRIAQMTCVAFVFRIRETVTATRQIRHGDAGRDARRGQIDRLQAQLGHVFQTAVGDVCIMSGIDVLQVGQSAPPTQGKQVDECRIRYAGMLHVENDQVGKGLKANHGVVVEMAKGEVKKRNDHGEGAETVGQGLVLVSCPETVFQGRQTEHVRVVCANGVGMVCANAIQDGIGQLGSF